ncbi:MAG: helix-turn-helix domain-containing protein [Clostridia bacterium]|nr:helix-turn-helix domain-containing protein [Clostridia bacterium]
MWEKYSILNSSVSDSALKVKADVGRVSNIDNINDISGVFHEEVEIKFFYEGSSTLLIGKETIVTQPGDVVVINPYEFHSTVDYGESKGIYHLLMVGLDFFDDGGRNCPDLRQIFTGERTSFQTLIRGNERLGHIITDIVWELNLHKNRYEQVVYGLMQQLFALLLRDYRSAGELELPTAKDIHYYDVIRPAIRKIRKDYAQHIGVDELAAMCNISKYHFCRIFKAVTGTSVVQYQNEYRLQIADVFLKKSNRSISEIAELCGFEDICYFSRCYKKHYGVSPREGRAILSK